jgi:hypothetical protein
MDFSGVALDTSKRVAVSVASILAMSISPASKISRITRVLGIVGLAYHSKMYSDSSTVFASTAVLSTGLEDPTQAERLANKLVRNYALGRQTDELISTYYESLLGQAQLEAFENAVSMGRVPTMNRSIVGETCKWCIGLAGTYTHPSGEMFARHENCDCLIVVSGYNSRNGIVDNYVKRKA